MKKGTQIRGIIFDLDGTLIDIHIPFEKIRKELNIPEGDILKKISLLPEDEQKRAYNLIDRLEYQAIPNSKSVCGAKEVIEYLNKNKIPYAVVTRGSKERARHLLKRHGLDIQFLVGREDAEPKPSPEAVALALKLMHLKPKDVLVVGDYFYDIEAGKKAGCRTALLLRPHKKKFENKADFTLDNLVELISLIEEKK